MGKLLGKIAFLGIVGGMASSALLGGKKDPNTELAESYASEVLDAYEDKESEAYSQHSDADGIVRFEHASEMHEVLDGKRALKTADRRLIVMTGSDIIDTHGAKKGWAYGNLYAFLYKNEDMKDKAKKAFSKEGIKAYNDRVVTQGNADAAEGIVNSFKNIAGMSGSDLVP